MKTPPPWQAQLDLAERLVAGILQRVFRIDSNARLRSRNELHADLLALNGVPGAKRRNTPRRLQRRRSQRQHQKQTRMNSNAQNALIVSGKTSEQKGPVTPSARASPRHSSGARDSATAIDERVFVTADGGREFVTTNDGRESVTAIGARAFECFE